MHEKPPPTSCTVVISDSSELTQHSNECQVLPEPRVCPPGIDSWINLSRVDPDAEVQGEVCLAVKLLEDARGRCLRCHVRQARCVCPPPLKTSGD